MEKICHQVNTFFLVKTFDPQPYCVLRIHTILIKLQPVQPFIAQCSLFLRQFLSIRMYDSRKEFVSSHMTSIHFSLCSSWIASSKHSCSPPSDAKNILTTNVPCIRLSFSSSDCNCQGYLLSSWKVFSYKILKLSFVNFLWIKSI